MKLTEVVTQLQLVLPKFTDLFSNTLVITSITSSSNIATITTSTAHGLSNNQAATISDVAQDNVIDSVTQDGLVFTFTTENNHDSTFGYVGYENVTFGGFDDTDWNTTHKLLAVVDRKTFKVQSTFTIPTLNATNFLSEIRIDGVNGRFAVTVVDTTNFTISGTFLDGIYRSGTVKTAVRIFGSATIDRAVESYTKQNVNDLWLIVAMNDAIVSKNRTTYNDAVATIANGQDIRIRLVDGFSVFIIKNTKNDIAAVDALDIARHDLLNPLTKSLYGARFSTGLTGLGDFVAILTGHNFVEYNRAILVYQYNFEFTTDLTLEDAVDPLDTKAFSDIDYTQSIGGDDTEDATIKNIELP